MKRIVLILFSPLLLDFAGVKLKKTKEPVQKSDTLSTKLKTLFFCWIAYFACLFDRLHICSVIKITMRRYRRRVLFAGINLRLSIATIPRGVVFIGYGEQDIVIARAAIIFFAQVAPSFGSLFSAFFFWILIARNKVENRLRRTWEKNLRKNTWKKTLMKLIQLLKVGPVYKVNPILL